MAPPRNIVNWMERTYPRPRVDHEWLQACCDWISEDKGLRPGEDQDEFTRQVELQLLSSDLHDSMVPSSGFPPHIRQQRKVSTGAQPILVEITALTEIGQSAFNLLNTRQARLEREDLAGLVEREREQNGQDGEDEGPVPNYPRQMLKLEVSDGTVSLPAVEYRKIPELILGETQLGCKIILKGAIVRNGILFLEPNNVVVKGHSTHDRDVRRDADFLRSLRQRMGLENPPNRPDDVDDYPPQDPPPPERLVRRNIATAEHDPNVEGQQRMNQAVVAPAAPAQSIASTSSTLVNSRFFAHTASTPDDNSPTQTLHRVLSPVGSARTIHPIDITDTSSDSLAASSSFLPPPPTSSARGTASSLAAAPTRKRDEFDLSSDFMDDAFLDEVNKVEQAAIAASVLPNSLHRQEPRAQERARAITVPRGDVIVIDDDDDDFEDFKENIPVAKATTSRVNPSRHVDVIDLSD